MTTKKVLVAGATGYLGQFIAHQLLEADYQPTLLVRNKATCGFDPCQFIIHEGDVTKPAFICNSFQNVDVVISAIGITRQKDGLTYMDVDYQANANLIEAARQHGVQKFIYVSALNGQQLRHLKIFQAKEKLVDELKDSGLEFCVIRPNGFFSDMGDFLKMAAKGTVYLFGDGQLRVNPIHGQDLACVCVDAVRSTRQEINVGGPGLFTQNEIAQLALQPLNKPIKIIHLPDWIRRLTIWLARKFTSSKTYGPIEFFLSAMAMDMIAPKYGHHQLGDYFRKQCEKIVT